jgi:predicted transcriptional regulator
MVIMVRNLVSACDTNAHGDLIRTAILAELLRSEIVVVSFVGLNVATTSFVNSAFVDLLDVLSFSQIKQRVRIVQSSQQINGMIRTRLTREADKLVAA